MNKWSKNSRKFIKKSEKNYTGRSHYRPFVIQVFPRDQRWPEAPHCSSDRSNFLSPPSPISSLLNHLQTNSLYFLSNLSPPSKKQCPSWPTGREVMTTSSCWVRGYNSTPSPTVQMFLDWKINVSYLRAADEGL